MYDTEGGWLQLTVEELVGRGRGERRARGWSGFKMKVGKPNVSEDVERVAAVREALGERVNIMVDANQSLTWAEASRLARLLEPLDVYWLEEPPGSGRRHDRTCAPRQIDVDPHRRGRKHLFAEPFSLRISLPAGAAGIVQVDAARIGGITPWLKTAHLAEAFNVKVAPHFLMELHVSLAAAIPNAGYVEHIHNSLH